MKTFLISPPFDKHGDDFDMLARAPDPQTAIDLFQLSMGEQRYSTFEQQADGPDDSLWTVRCIPPFSDPLVARIVVGDLADRQELADREHPVFNRVVDVGPGDPSAARSSDGSSPSR